RGGEAGADVALFRPRRVRGGRERDPEVAAGRARRRLLAAQLVVARHFERLVEGSRIVAAVVEPAGRRPVRKLIWLHEVLPADLDWIDRQSLGQPFHHALRLEAELAARVAAAWT